MKNTCLLIFTIFFLYSCSSSSIKLNEYSLHNLKESSNMPSQDALKNKTTKVLILELSNNNINIATQAKLGKSLSSKLETVLAQAKSVQVVKRLASNNYNKMIENEIKAAELAKEVGSDVGQADYIITGKVSNATYNYSFKEGYYYKIKIKSGTKLVYQPPVVRYKACVNGNVKIFSLPEFNEVKSIVLDECSSYSEEVRSPRDAKSKNNSLLREAGEETIAKASYPLKSFFAKKGYIYASKIKDDEIIVETSLGLDSGAKPDEEVEVWSIEKYVNPLSKVSTKIEVKVANGTISNQITSVSSWIIIDDIMDGKNIHIGDYVKIKYEEGFFSSFGRLIN